ncbi:MAG: hypothetical protein IT324_29195 [Anaerolineae bacterium]|nr:hypothetical protein [Anaerolineae bacterium]
MNPDAVPDYAAWQFAQTAVGMAALLATAALLFFFLIGNRTRKALSCHVFAVAPLPGLSDSLQLVFHGESITSGYLVLVRVSNVGNTLISAADYELPISLKFADNTHILSAAITDTTPEGSATSLRIEGTTVTLTQPPLERGESLGIALLVDNYQQPVQVDWRIAGTKDTGGIHADPSTWSIGTIQTLLTAVALALTFTSCILSTVAVVGPSTLSLPTAPIVLVILTSLILIPVITVLRRSERVNRG